MTDVAASRVSMCHALSAAFGYIFSNFGYILRVSWPLFVLMFAPLVLQYIIGPIPSLHFNTMEEAADHVGLIATVAVLWLVYLVLFALVCAALFITFARDYFLGARPARFRQVLGATLGRYLLVCLLGFCVGIGLIIAPR